MTAIEYANNKEEIDNLEEINDEITMDEYKEQERQENSFECVKCGTFFTEESNAYQGFTCDSCLEDKEEDEQLTQEDKESNKETFNLIEPIDNSLQQVTEIARLCNRFIVDKITDKEFDVEVLTNDETSSTLSDYLDDMLKVIDSDLKQEYKSISLSKAQKDTLLLYILDKIVSSRDPKIDNINGLLYNRALADIHYFTINEEHRNLFQELKELEVIHLERPKPVEQEKEQTETETSFKDLSAFSITWKTKHDFEQVLKSANTLNDEITFTVDGDGLHYRSMDASHVALIDVFLAQSCFERFELPETLTKFGIRADETLKILQQIENNESLEIRLNADKMVLEISNKEGFKSKIRIIESSEQSTPLPKLTYNSEITLTDKAINILKKRSQLGEYFTIETKDNEYVNFIARNDMGEFEQKFDNKSEGLAELKTKEDSVATYSVDYMMKFLKSFTSIKPKEFKFEYSSKMPLRIEVPEINGRMHFYLAPRIQD